MNEPNIKYLIAGELLRGKNLVSNLSEEVEQGARSKVEQAKRD